MIYYHFNWTLFLGILGIAAPFLGLALGVCLFSTRHFASRWSWAAIYYAPFFVAWAIPHHWFPRGTTILMYLTLWFIGPFLGIGLAIGHRTRQRRRGICHQCGYDLRASPQRCPECGAANAFQQADEEARRLAEALRHIPVSDELELPHAGDPREEYTEQ